jgi:cytidylate kinase
LSKTNVGKTTPSENRSRPEGGYALLNPVSVTLPDQKPRITIAIDGYSACGKSTLAKRLARELGYLYIDTGAMYRAVTLYFLRREIDYNDDHATAETLEHIYLQFIANEDPERRDIHLNGENVESDIRSLLVADRVCDLAAIPTVRRHLVAQQRELGKDGGVVLDGRDIGTVVFPGAELKFFVTANMDVRVARRRAELQAKGQNPTREAVEANLQMRDREETTRAESPLRQAPDAIGLDTSHLDADAVLQAALQHVQARMAD